MSTSEELPIPNENNKIEEENKNNDVNQKSDFDLTPEETKLIDSYSKFNEENIINNNHQKLQDNLTQITSMFIEDDKKKIFTAHLLAILEINNKKNQPIIYLNKNDQDKTMYKYFDELVDIPFDKDTSIEDLTKHIEELTTYMTKIDKVNDSIKVFNSKRFLKKAIMRKGFKNENVTHNGEIKNTIEDILKIPDLENIRSINKEDVINKIKELEKTIKEKLISQKQIELQSHYYYKENLKKIPIDKYDWTTGNTVDYLKTYIEFPEDMPTDLQDVTITIVGNEINGNEQEKTDPMPVKQRSKFIQALNEELKNNLHENETTNIGGKYKKKSKKKTKTNMKKKKKSKKLHPKKKNKITKKVKKVKKTRRK